MQLFFVGKSNFFVEKLDLLYESDFWLRTLFFAAEMTSRYTPQKYSYELNSPFMFVVILGVFNFFGNFLRMRQIIEFSAYNTIEVKNETDRFDQGNRGAKNHWMDF